MFQVVWVIAVGFAAKGLAWPGVAAALTFAAIHFLFMTRTRAADLRIVAVAMVLGFLLDSVIAWLGWLQYAAPEPATWLAPWWIMALWLAFSLTLNHSMSWLQGKPALAIAFGAIGGPLVFYFASHFWGAVVVPDPAWRGYGALAVEWALMTPLLLYVGSSALLRRTGALT